jgi:hypothetical protein
MRRTTLGVLPAVAAALIAVAGTATAAPASAPATVTRAANTYCVWTVDPNIDFLRVHTRPDVNSPVPYQIAGGTHVTAALNTYAGPGGPFRYGAPSGHSNGYMASRYLVNRGVCFT